MTTINIWKLIKNLGLGIKQEYKEIPWKTIAGMRDVTAHKYQALRMEDVYNTIKIDFPYLKEKVGIIIKSNGNED